MVLFVILFSFEEVCRDTEGGTEHTELEKLPGEYLLWCSRLEVIGFLFLSLHLTTISTELDESLSRDRYHFFPLHILSVPLFSCVLSFLMSFDFLISLLSSQPNNEYFLWSWRTQGFLSILKCKNIYILLWPMMWSSQHNG